MSSHREFRCPLNRESVALHMHMTRLKCIAMALLLTVAPSASASQAVNENEMLLGAMSPFEDIVEFALAGADSDISKALAAADQQAAGVKTVLTASAAAQFSVLLADLHRAVKDKAHHQAARNAVAAFRLLVDNLQAKGLKEPKEIALLDYAGFNLLILAAAPSPRWQDIHKTASETARWWAVIKPQISQKGLRDAFDTTIRGLNDAVKQENLPMLRFAAQMDLDLVDLLEADPGPRR